MRKDCLSMLFFLKRAQQKKSGEIPVYARIIANGTRVDFSTDRLGRCSEATRSGYQTLGVKPTLQFWRCGQR